MSAARRLCFIGDSLIEYYDWQARFPRQEVVSLGLAGETAAELLARLASFRGSPYRPEAVVVMTGTNDLLMGEDFPPSMEAIVSTLRGLWPEAGLLLNGLMPMDLPWLPPDLIVRANARLEELALRHKIGYLDGCRLMSDPGARAACFLEDGVHLSPRGYALWSAAIENHLRLTGCV